MRQDLRKDVEIDRVLIEVGAARLRHRDEIRDNGR
jgi:hypothetical protein